jgi:hypothetical protein
MKSLRISALILALGAFSICPVPTHAQQEIEPDHFDQSSALSTHVHRSKTQSHHSASAAPRQTNKKLASARSHKAQHGLRS